MTFNPANNAALKSELQTDPKTLGYAAFVSERGAVGIAGLVNALTGAGTGVINVSQVSKDTFVLAIAPEIYANLSTLSATKQQQWRDILGIINGAATVDVSSANVQALLNQAIADTLLTQAQINAATQRTGSRAEVLWGENTVVSDVDVRHAMGW